MAKKKAVAEELKAPAVKGLLRDVPDPTVYLNGVLRFDDDHIIRVKYDPTSKAMVIDDVPQSLESSITLGGGGGGGEISNPVFTLTLTNPTNDHTSGDAYGYLMDEHGYAMMQPFNTPESTTVEMSFAIMPELSGDDPYAYIQPPVPVDEDTIVIASMSDLVNCTWDLEGNWFTITDVTQPASATVVYRGK